MADRCPGSGGRKPCGEKKAGKGSRNLADKCPGQLVVLLVIWGISVFALLYLWHFYAGVVGGNSLPVPAEVLPAYRKLLLVTVFVDILIWILLFLGLKAGFWAAVVFISLDLLSKILTLNLRNALLDALYLYLLLCQPTRIYFRIGQFKAFGPREK